MFAVTKMPKIRDAMGDALAVRSGGARALWFEGVWHDWGTVRASIAQLDLALSALGAGPGARIGLVGRNRPPELVSLMALLATGRCAVMLNGRLGEAALCEEVRARDLDALIGASALLDSPAMSAASRQGKVSRVAIGDTLSNGFELLERFDATPREPGGSAAEILTSGTTGRPKPFAYSESMLDQVIPSIIASQPLMGDCAGPDGPPLVEFMPLTAIGGFCFAAISLLTGRGQVLHEKFSPSAFAKAARTFRPAMVGLNPSLMRMTLDFEVDPADLSSLQAVRSGSAPLDPLTFQRWSALYGIPIIPVYGATEFGGPIVSWTLDLLERQGAARQGSVGRAWPGVELRVVKPQSEDAMPALAIGRLDIRTPRIGPDWVETTDLAALDEDGFLYIHGRVDEAINRGGNKIVPEVVADVIRKHPAVLDAAVVGLPDPVLGEVPVAAVECRTGFARPAEEELLDLVRANLAAYQVPTKLVILPSLPRTEFLKVARRELKAILSGL